MEMRSEVERENMRGNAWFGWWENGSVEFVMRVTKDGEVERG